MDYWGGGGGGGGGAKGMLAPPLKLFGGPGPPWPPSSYAYVTVCKSQQVTINFKQLEIGLPQENLYPMPKMP